MGDRKLPERAEVEAWETLLAERDRYREALERVRENALSWHGPSTDTGHAKALAVIALWCDGALNLMTAAPSLPVGPTHLPHKDVAEGVVAHREARTGAICDGVVAGGLDDLADAHEVGSVEPADGDLYPVADGKLHHPIVTDPRELSYAAVRCGICGWTTGCECGSSGPQSNEEEA